MKNLNEKPLLFVNGKKLGVIENLVFTDFPSEGITTVPKKFPSFKKNDMKLEMECELELIDMPSFRKVIKKLFHLPRKKKKKLYGTRDAKKRILKRSRLGLKLTIDDFRRAGLRHNFRDNYFIY